MTNLNIKEGLKKRIGALALATFMMAAPKVASANTTDANNTLDECGIVYQLEDSIATNLVVNAEDVYVSKIKNGAIPTEYNEIAIDPVLTLDSVNQMRESLLNYNVNMLFTQPEQFKYVSMGIYMDDEVEKKILTDVAVLVETFAKNPTDLETLDRLINIFRGLDKEISTAKLSVGGMQALANDVYFVSALVQVYGLNDYAQLLTDLANAYGDNGTIITYINGINGNVNCR